MNNHPTKHAGLATASLVLGILSIPFGIVGIGALFGILAIIFGIIGLKANQAKSVTGIITGSVGILVFGVVILVLAIVIPRSYEGIQSRARDAQRKSDISTLSSDVAFYTSNNNGQLPDVQWVSGMTYKLDSITAASSSSSPSTNEATYQTGIDCNGVASARNFAIRILLESGQKYCQGS